MMFPHHSFMGLEEGIINSLDMMPRSISLRCHTMLNSLINLEILNLIRIKKKFFRIGLPDSR